MPEESSQEFVLWDLSGMLANDLAHFFVALAGHLDRDATFQRLWLAEERLRQEPLNFTLHVIEIYAYNSNFDSMEAVVPATDETAAE